MPQAHQFLRLDFSQDATPDVVRELTSELMRADPFEPAPVVYVAGHERKAREVRRQVRSEFPEGTPERVARELLKRFAPHLLLSRGVERDFDLFALLHEALHELGMQRGASRALVDEVLNAWRRMTAALPPGQREFDALAWLESLGPRGRLLRTVVARYDESLRRRSRIDHDDVLWHCAELLPRWRQSGFAPRLVVADELDEVSPARAHFLTALLGCGERSLVILRGTGETIPFLRPAQEALQDIVLRSLRGGPRAAKAPDDHPRAALVRAWLEGAPLALPSGVSVRQCPTRQAELAACVRDIKRLAFSGVSLDRIAVALPRAEHYAAILDEVFSDAGVPFDSPLEEPLSDTPPVAALLGLVRCARLGFERAELLDALASPLLCFGAASDEERARRLARLEQISRDAGVVGGPSLKEDWLKPLESAAEKPAAQDLRFLESLFQGLQPFARREVRPAAFFDALKRLTEASEMSRVLKLDARKGLPGAARRMAALHEFGRLTRDLLEGFARIGDQPMSGAELHRALVEQAQTRGVREPESDGPRVRVLGLKELRGSAFEHVFVLGLTDRDLPLSEGDSMFLSRGVLEEVEGALGAAAARTLCLPVDTAAQSDYLFSGLLLSGRESLCLSLPRQEGETPFVAAAPLARLLALAGLQINDMARQPDLAPVSEGELSAAAGMALREVELGAPALGRLTLDAAFLGAGVRGREVELCRSDVTAPPTAFDGLVGGLPELAAAFSAQAPDATRHVFSPSQLDTYAECPQRFWLRYVLHIRQPEEPTRDTPPTAVGTLVHRVFELFVHALRLSLGQPALLENPLERRPVMVRSLADDEEEARSRARELMRQALASARDELKPHGAFWAGTLRLLGAGLDGNSELGLGLLARFIDHELERNAAGLGIRFVELRIGPGETATEDQPDVCAGALDMPLGQGFIRLRGSIDRVDEGPQGLEIIDYKTGSSKTTAEVRDGAAFQLPVYLAAVSAKTGSAPHGMSYLKTPPIGVISLNDVTQQRGKPAYNVPELVTRHLPRRLEAMLDALSRGVFVHLPWRPPGGSPCSYCEFATACARHDDVIVKRQQRVAQGDAASVAGAYRPDAAPGAKEETE
ncbi:PD-(D/E)XK nuclease family protein [bacterium]|nr:MAG: PD-(D/E)XK nuclease family protein [bacterium]RIK64629.1 MAG: hypothetical protein DCC64_03385 [Planctomycetota bacterium]